MRIREAEHLGPPVWYYSARFLDRVSQVGGAITCAAALVVATIAQDGLPAFVAVGLLAAAVGVSAVTDGRFAMIAAVPIGVVAIVWTDLDFAGWIVVISILFSSTLRGRRSLIASLVAAVALYFATASTEVGGFTDPGAYVAFTTTLAAAATGYAIRTHEEYLLSIRQRAQDAITSREADIDRRITEERLRIAQDLHDVLGHEIAVIGMHLGVIDVNLPTSPSPTRAALETAQREVRVVLDETQRILGVLRRGESGSDRARPVPAVENIIDLVRRVEAGGARVHLEVPDVLAPLQRGVSAAAYRMVQEALTNSHRHGDGPIAVRIDQHGGVLTVAVENAVRADAVRRDGNEAGYGLVGMRERIEAAGGVFEARTERARFRVAAMMRSDGGPLR